MEKHCTSLEISKQLKESGWKKQLEYYWKEDIYPLGLCEEVSLFHCSTWIPEDNHLCKFYPAPLATEILEELPVDLSKIGSYLSISKLLGEYVVEYGSDCPEIGAELLPNALAKMWLFLKKENL